MPRTDVAYGKSYRPCPCAQMHEKSTSDNTYFTATCYSPKRKPCKITDTGQVGICMGGTYQGKRYTSCPYYVRNAQIKVPKRTKSNSLGVIVGSWFGFIFFLALAISCLKGDLKVTGLTAIICLAIAIACVAHLFIKSDKIDTTPKDRKKK